MKCKTSKVRKAWRFTSLTCIDQVLQVGGGGYLLIIIDRDSARHGRSCRHAVVLIRRSETEDELVGVTSDYRVEHQDLVRIRGIAQYIALAVELETGRYRVRLDELRVGAMHRFGITETGPLLRGMIDDHENATRLQSLKNRSGEQLGFDRPH